jgi:hypothetical protein
MSNHFLSLLDTFFSLMFIYSKKTEKCLFLNAHLIKWCLHLLLFSTFHHIKGYYIIEVFYDTVKVAFSLPADSQTTI